MGDTDVLVAILLSDGHIAPLFIEYLKLSTKRRKPLSTPPLTIFYSAVDHVERIYGYTRLKRYPIIIAAGYNKTQAFSNWKVESTIYTAIVYTAIALTLLLIMSSMGVIVLK
ncbi:MAG: hypothetical protein ACR5K7_02385 [Symbiopectobacterium sp.]